mgnify:CR=1 FL=1
MNEFELIKNYFSVLSSYNKHSLSLNDDVFFDKSKGLVVSVDAYIEGIHFLNFDKPDLVIKKLLRSSISDIICKGVYPKYYFISAAGDKKKFSTLNLKKISKSLNQEQKKYNISLSGGDTVFSKKLSFSITTIGYSKSIIFRNKAKLNDDIYVTGNLGDSFIGLKILKNQTSFNKSLNKYFINKYYHPDINIKFTKKLYKCANTSIDISDGLFADLDKLINKQNLSYKLNLKKIPVSKNLEKLLRTKKKLNKLSVISQGDDFQILFTAPISKARIINKISKSIGLKISKIGKICNNNQKSSIIDEKGNKKRLNYKGYIHKF